MRHFSVGRKDRPKAERRAAAQALGGRSVPKNQLPNHPLVFGLVERLRTGLPCALAEGHATARVRLEVARPGGFRRTGRNEQPLGLLDEPDGDRHRSAGLPSARLDERDRSPFGQLAADRIVRQRLRCQDLPSVATAGA